MTEGFAAVLLKCARRAFLQARLACPCPCAAVDNCSVFVTFLTAGYPTPDATVDLLLALEAGGADIIELGVPFSDPMADGAVIQKANNVAIEQGVDYPKCLSMVKEAREKGLKAPVIFMGELSC